MLKTERLENGDVVVIGPKGSMTFRNVVGRGLMWIEWKAGSSDAPDYPLPSIISTAQAEAEKVLALPRAA